LFINFFSQVKDVAVATNVAPAPKSINIDAVISQETFKLMEERLLMLDEELRASKLKEKETQKYLEIEKLNSTQSVSELEALKNQVHKLQNAKLERSNELLKTEERLVLLEQMNSELLGSSKEDEKSIKQLQNQCSALYNQVEDLKMKASLKSNYIENDTSVPIKEYLKLESYAQHLEEKLNSEISKNNSLEKNIEQLTNQTYQYLKMQENINPQLLFKGNSSDTLLSSMADITSLVESPVVESKNDDLDVELLLNGNIDLIKGTESNVWTEKGKETFENYLVEETPLEEEKCLEITEEHESIYEESKLSFYLYTIWFVVFAGLLAYAFNESLPYLVCSS
jgi:hypothetical protein